MTIRNHTTSTIVMVCLIKIVKRPLGQLPQIKMNILSLSFVENMLPIYFLKILSVVPVLEEFG